MERRQVDEVVATERCSAVRDDARGFTLIEVLVAMVVLMVGLLSLVGVLAVSVRRVGVSSNQLIAREKAREAVESVHSARDTGRTTWGNIQNVSAGGIFVAGEQDLREPGADGIVNTSDDASAPYQTIRKPGPNGILGDGDDEVLPLSDFKREVTITTIIDPVTSQPNPNLRQIVVKVRYRVDTQWRTYTLTTYVSSFS